MKKRDSAHIRRLGTGLAASLPLIFVSLAGCGGSSSSDPVPAPSSRTGTFGSTAVAGLTYQTGNQSTDATTATTDEQGRFRYTANQNVSFSIGELVLGEAAGADNLTVVSISAGAVSATRRSRLAGGEALRVLNRSTTSTAIYKPCGPGALGASEADRSGALGIMPCIIIQRTRT